MYQTQNNNLQIITWNFTMISVRRLHKVRRRFHRAFFRWLHANQSRFLTPQFRVISRTDRFITFTILGLDPILTFGLSTWELGIHVEWKDAYWDSLAYFECWPNVVSEGYICDLCEVEKPKYYISREALWIDHVFEPFLEWVNTELTSFRYLALFGEPGESTCAELVSKTNLDLDLEGGIIRPIWLE
jgi:hypothetical protein